MFKESMNHNKSLDKMSEFENIKKEAKQNGLN